MLNRERVVAFDADGVLINSEVPVLENVNKKLKTNYSVEGWIFYTYLYKEVIRLTGEDPDDVVAWMFGTPVMSTAKPHADALQISKKLADHDYRQLVFTSRPPAQSEATKDWFGEFYPWIKREDVRLRPEGSKLSGEQFKLSQIKEFSPLTFIDDSAETVKFLLDNGILSPNLLIALLLRDRPWNRELNEPSVIRAKQMSRILEELKIA